MKLEYNQRTFHVRNDIKLQYALVKFAKEDKFKACTSVKSTKDVKLEDVICVKSMIHVILKDWAGVMSANDVELNSSHGHQVCTRRYTK